MYGQEDQSRGKVHPFYIPFEMRIVLEVDVEPIALFISKLLTYR